MMDEKSIEYSVKIVLFFSSNLLFERKKNSKRKRLEENDVKRFLTNILCHQS